MLKKLFILALVFSAAFAQKPTLQSAMQREIIVNNNILAKINGKNISMLDVKKKLDYMIHQSNPEIVSSDAAKYQFYLSYWRFALVDIINNELMLAEAESKNVQMPDSEIRVSMQEKFGPNITLTLEKLNLSYDEAFAMVKTEEIAKRMRWLFINSKALQKVTPQMILKEYEDRTKGQPAGDMLHFQIATIKSANEAESSSLALKAHQLLKNKKANSLEDIKQQLPSKNIQVSSEYSACISELSEAYKEALSSLTEGEYSSPVSQISQYDGKIAWRIFYLKKKENIRPASFDSMAEKIKNELLQEVAKEESAKYLEGLHKKYSIDEITLHRILSDESASPFFLR